jgi:hypothetical protein
MVSLKLSSVRKLTTVGTLTRVFTGIKTFIKALNVDPLLSVFMLDYITAMLYK